jgi:hypothetical protein
MSRQTTFKVKRIAVATPGKGSSAASHANAVLPPSGTSVAAAARRLENIVGA